MSPEGTEQMDSAAIAKPMSEVPAWHAVAADEVLRQLNTDPKKGLDTNEVSQRLSKYGLNRLPEGKKQGPLIRFLSQFNNILVYVLLGAGFVKLMVGLFLDAAIILGVVIINALRGFIQEGKAEKALNSIRNMLSAEANLAQWRNRPGAHIRISRSEIISGVWIGIHERRRQKKSFFLLTIVFRIFYRQK